MVPTIVYLFLFLASFFWLIQVNHHRGFTTCPPQNHSALFRLMQDFSKKHHLFVPFFPPQRPVSPVRVWMMMLVVFVIVAHDPQGKHTHYTKHTPFYHTLHLVTRHFLY
ncbi:MAG: hypothetical protein ACYSUC_06740 [Planctomycetota bacterium]|jgi:hypothetical protein